MPASPAPRFVLRSRPAPPTPQELVTDIVRAAGDLVNGSLFAPTTGLDHMRRLAVAVLRLPSGLLTHAAIGSDDELGFIPFNT